VSAEYFHRPHGEWVGVVSATSPWKGEARVLYATCRMEPATTRSLDVRPMTPEQVAWRLLRDHNAEFVAIAPTGYWVAVAMENRSATDPAETSNGMRPSTADRVEIVDVNRASADDVRRILDSAVAVVGSAARTTQGHPLRRMIDLHYDVPVGIRSLKDRVNRLVFGYRLTMERDGRRRTYRYPGIVHRKGVRWIGQSVLRLPPVVAEEVEALLRGWGVPVTLQEVYEGY